MELMLCQFEILFEVRENMFYICASIIYLWSYCVCLNLHHTES